jgi:hypothetical protein
MSSKQDYRDVFAGEVCRVAIFMLRVRAEVPDLYLGWL